VLADRLYLCQVGDSRGYLVRNGTAIQVTKDQSLVQRLIDAGELTAEEAETSERRNIILQALGPEGQVKVDLTTQQVRRGDVLVLCSDGMSGQMRSADIARIVTEQAPDLMATCKALIDLANENGGPDNITVIVARFEGEGLEPPVQGDFVGHQPYVSPAEARATLPVSAATIEQSMQDAALLEMSLVTTAETEIPVAPNHEAASGARSTTPIAPPPSAPAATPRLTVEQQRQVRVVFIGVTVLVTAWLIWAYLLKG